MAKVGFDDVVFQIDDDEGGLLRDLSAYLLSISGIGIEAVLEEGHTAGDSWVRQLFTGLKRGDALTFVFFFDDTTDTVEDTFANSVGETRSVDIDDGIETASGEVIIRKKTKLMARGTVTKLEVITEWTGTITEAASA